LESAEVLAKSGGKTEAEARARGEAEERKQKEREMHAKNRAELEGQKAVALAHDEKAKGEAQANTEAEVQVQASLEGADRAAGEARAASATKRGAVCRFVAEQLVAVTPPESTSTANNEKSSRSKGPISGFLKQVLVKNKMNGVGA
jgi:hypothetical protein